MGIWDLVTGDLAYFGMGTLGLVLGDLGTKLIQRRHEWEFGTCNWGRHEWEFGTCNWGHGDLDQDFAMAMGSLGLVTWGLGGSGVKHLSGRKNDDDDDDDDHNTFRPVVAR